MTAVLRLDQALDLVLRDRAFRRAALAGAPDLGLAPADAALLRGLDPDELEQAARALRVELLGRKHRGVGTLVDVYPRTFAAWRAGFAGPSDHADDELAACLLESPAYAAHRELPYAGGPGTCLEEAFFRFAEHAGIGDPEVRQLEFLRAMIRAIATSSAPSFTIPDELHVDAAGAWAIGPGPCLFATAGGRVIEGPIQLAQLGLVLAQLGLAVSALAFATKKRAPDAVASGAQMIEDG